MSSIEAWFETLKLFSFLKLRIHSPKELHEKNQPSIINIKKINKLGMFHISKDGDSVSHMAIRRRLKKFGYKSVPPTDTSPQCSQLINHNETRIEWARDYLNDSWERILFSNDLLSV